MSVVKIFGVAACAGIGGLGLFTADYLHQWSKTNAGFGGRHYMETLIDRFGESGGAFGLMVRKPSIVAAARPPAPTGWSAENWRADHDAYLFSPAQRAVLEREIERATLGLPDSAALGRTGIGVHDAYKSETSMTYRNAQGVIALSIHAPDQNSPHPDWAAHQRAINAHFDRIDTLIEYETRQGLTWFEAHGPVELADNDKQPHRLRRFQARLGSIDLYLTTRTPDPHVRRFIETVDLSALRALARDRPADTDAPQPLPEVVRAASVAGAPAAKRVTRGLD